jgi:hypothetical protein
LSDPLFRDSARRGRAQRRHPRAPVYAAAKELPDGDNAPVKADGNFILGPTRNPAQE